MKNYSRFSLFLIFMGLLLLPFINRAQENVPPPFNKYWFVEPNLGVAQYFGDLNESDVFNKNLRLGYGGLIGYQFSPVLGIRAKGEAGKLFGERDVNGLKLESDFWDAGLDLTVNITELILPYKPSRFFNFSLFTGGMFTSYHSKTTDLTTNVINEETDGRVSDFTLPLGGLLSFRLTDNFYLNLQHTDHLIASDKTLDHFEADHKRDHYSYSSVGLEIRFGTKDSDKDGMVDKKDICPLEAGKVQLAGCPDKDNDGIPDKDDLCPDIAGKAEFKGCPDKDNDGIPDKDDLCPDNAGKKELSGCPDKDNDGIADKDDRCPDAAGKAEFKGCPDRDGDKIPDIDDDCPDVQGLAAFRGCPDDDGDGIPNIKDQCPDVPGTMANNGCPEVKEVLINEVVHFATDGWVVLALHNQQLQDKVVEVMKDNPGIRISVEGHTDSRESKGYNMALSEKRARYIVKFITEKGIDSSRITLVWYGETKPAVDNKTAAGMAVNRRVEINSIK